MRHYAVIVTHNRHQWCTNLVGQLAADDVETVVIDNASDPPFRSDLARTAHIPDQPPNLSALWNRGLDIVQFLHANVNRAFNEDYVVAVLNDDISIPEGFVQSLGRSIILHDVDVAFPDQHQIGVDVVDKSPPRTCLDMYRRMTGYAFAIRGSSGIRAREEMVWWYSDNGIEMDARAGRGTVLVGGLTVEHHDPNGYTTRRPELARQAEIDRQTFRRIYGFPAW